MKCRKFSIQSLTGGWKPIFSYALENFWALRTTRQEVKDKHLAWFHRSPTGCSLACGERDFRIAFETVVSGANIRTRISTVAGYCPTIRLSPRKKWCPVRDFQTTAFEQNVFEPESSDRKSEMMGRTTPTGQWWAHPDFRNECLEPGINASLSIKLVRALS